MKLLQDLQTFNKEQEKFNHLRTIFIDPADVDEYTQYLDTDEELDLTKRQLIGLKATLEGFKVCLMEYLEQTASRIEKFDKRLRRSDQDIVNPDLTPEEVDEITHTRKRVVKAMQIAKSTTRRKRQKS